jgi:hypothetical protein
MAAGLQSCKCKNASVDAAAVTAANEEEEPEDKVITSTMLAP